MDYIMEPYSLQETGGGNGNMDDVDDDGAGIDEDAERETENGEGEDDENVENGADGEKRRVVNYQLSCTVTAVYSN